MNYQALWEAVKEGLRWLACMVLAYAVDLLITVIPGMGTFLGETLGLDPVLVQGILTILFRAIDKFVHELNKARETKVPLSFTNGLLPF